MHSRFASFVVILLLAATPAFAQKRALFDNAHAEQAGNADWVIDNDFPDPIPAQSGIGPSTPRTYWLGAISSWGVDLVKRGYTVRTNTTAFTYGNVANPNDLANFDVLIIPEPNTSFSASEVTAIFSFVNAGGGLVCVSDHDISDRNGDGIDSPKVYNAMDPGHLFGVHAGSTGDANANIVQTSSNVNVSASDSIIVGAVGTATSLAFHNGTTFTLYPGVNPTVRGEVWMTGLPQTSVTGVMAASSTYGNGHVFFIGDSSPADDGSANPGNSNIFDGWAEATDSTLIMNATIWATRRPLLDTTPPSVTLAAPNGGESWSPNSVQTISWTASDLVGIDSVRVEWSSNGAPENWQTLTHGVPNINSFDWSVPDVPTDSARVRVTAWDHALNTGSDESAAPFQIVDPNVGIGSPSVSTLAFARPAPNPSAGSTTLRFAIPSAASVRLTLFDVSGRKVWSRAERLSAGEHAWSWDGRSDQGIACADGLYFARLATPFGVRSRSLSLLR